MLNLDLIGRVVARVAVALAAPRSLAGRRSPLLIARWRMGICLCAVLLYAPPSRTHAAEEAPLEAARFFQHAALFEAELSPSGHKLAITTSQGGSRAKLVVVDLAAVDMRARVVASYSNMDVVAFRWVSDDRLVFGLTDLVERDGHDLRPPGGLFAVDADGQNFRALIARTRRFDGGVSNSFLSNELSPDHFLLRIPRLQQGVVPGEIIIGEPIWSGRKLERVKPLWLDTRTGYTRPVKLDDAPKGVQQWLFDSKGEPRVALTSGEGRSRLYWRGPGEFGWRMLSDEDALRPRFRAHQVGDDGTLYVLQSKGEDETEVLTRFDFKAMAPEAVPMVRAPGFDFLGHVTFDEDGSRVLGVRVHTDSESTVWLNETMQGLQREVDARLPGQVNRIQCRRCGQPDMVALVYSYSDRNPGQWLVYRAEGKRWEGLGPVLEGVDPRRMAAVDFVRIKARDGRDLPVWLTKPRQARPGRPAPAVVLVHDGPWRRGGFWEWTALEQFLASRGYIVIKPEFRGSDGFGEAHFRAGWKQWGQAMQDDIADALQWTQAQGLADRQRVCIVGGGSGGYAVLMGLVRHPDAYRCGVAWSPIADPLLMVEGTWWTRRFMNEENRRYFLPELVGDAEKDRDMLTAVSPVAQARRIRAPLLLVSNVTESLHVQRLLAALKEAGHPPELVKYQDEPSAWRKVSTMIDFAQHMETFLAQHLQTSPQASAGGEAAR